MNEKEALNFVRLSDLIEEGLMKSKKKDKKYFLEIDDEDDIEEFNCNYCYYIFNNISNSIPPDNNQTLCPPIYDL